ncbi:uroporphyrinogen-III synthase [Xenophilus sp. Marseille-Q4582]|uniref:uroporphyrinogen-III synthase n=1 Tax=Xenophilus sp. Marseille-Q4582 TaxID=2866600 RepID=UPI001CE420F7|nr:uroporphyrinogen-III synthase [Xenophilus sp. Marseille-Q4582]
MPSHSSRLIVTRPEPEASRWVQALQAQGQAARALPLIVIRPEVLPAASRPAPGAHAALMFVSGAAVRAFFGQVPAAAMLQGATRCWCTGPGTAAALREAGVPAAAIDSPPEAAQQFDSEALWAQVRAQVRSGTRVCIVRGGNAQGQPAGRDWLARTLADAGAQVDTLVAYRRLPPPADAAWQADVQQAVAARDVWLFSSSEAVIHLREAMAGTPELDWAACRALATHARIADAARQLGFGQVQTVAPLLPSVLAALRAG